MGWAVNDGGLPDNVSDHDIEQAYGEDDLDAETIPAQDVFTKESKRRVNSDVNLKGGMIDEN